MAKFNPGDKVIISKDSKNIWIQGKKATVIRFLEENNVPGSFYQWTYEVKLEDGDKCYVPQWEMELEKSDLQDIADTLANLSPREVEILKFACDNDNPVACRRDIY